MQQDIVRNAIAHQIILCNLNLRYIIPLRETSLHLHLADASNTIFVFTVTQSDLTITKCGGRYHLLIGSSLEDSTFLVEDKLQLPK